MQRKCYRSFSVVPKNQNQRYVGLSHRIIFAREKERKGGIEVLTSVSMDLKTTPPQASTTASPSLSWKASHNLSMAGRSSLSRNPGILTHTSHSVLEASSITSH